LPGAASEAEIGYACAPGAFVIETRKSVMVPSRPSRRGAASSTASMLGVMKLPDFSGLAERHLVDEA
jgi:hypothetical protein